ncbi:MULTISPECIES: MFS transporter [Roseivirga]|uniref:MFS transporter n=1 Tax=Roseivirga spongicola TaxID=333140 RepID=A0A150XAB0_9BACT|nr:MULTISPECIES: MFS transporter [Roseivirga]KYG75669.1 MFS transporter [Roseivirga spongicola]MBO6662436.1 MFS transporter [Roseivirga sp.]MBO6761010.1 MFS transporter [Roseivirga sp.]MBO6910000.1 MFS transporter [Roseivirga sp.]WPZ10765.1 MFS transporter [Roseivirga spongicola]
MAEQKSIFSLQFCLLCLSSLLFFSSFNMIVPDLYDYLTSLGGGELKGLVISLFTVTAGLSRPFSGKLSDTIGRIPVMIFGAGVCFVVGFLYPMLGTVWAFLLLRFLHGFSTGFKPTGTAAYLADIVPRHRRGEAMGYSGLFGSLGMAAGPSFGPMITEQFGLDAMFYSSSALAILSVLILAGMKETLPNKQKFSLELLKINKSDIFEPRVINPSILFLLTSFSFGAALTLMPDLTISIGFDQGNKGIFFTIFVFSSLLIRILAGKASDKYGRVIVLKWAALAIVVADLMVAFTHTEFMLIASSIAFGIAVGLNTPTIYAWTIDLSHDEKRGKGLATMYIALEIGIGLGAFSAGFIYANEIENLRNAFIVSAILSFLGFLFLNFGLNWGNKLFKVQD